MKHLVFPAETYIAVGPDTYRYEGLYPIGLVEALWTSIETSPCKNLTRKDHKIIKDLKTKVREITFFKDPSQDVRVALAGPQSLLLENEEYEVLCRLLDAGSVSSKFSELITDLWSIIENASNHIPDKPRLI